MSAALCPPDHTHGSSTTCYHKHGCRCAPCRAIRSRKTKKARHVAGARVFVSGEPTRRRLRALQAIGYTLTDLSLELGKSKNYAGRLMQHRQVRSDVHVAVARLYERLHMTPVTDAPHAALARAVAARHNAAPPLAWDDIDRDEKPNARALRVPA